MERKERAHTVASYSSDVPSKHNTSVRGFQFEGTGAGVEEHGSVVIAEELGQQEQGQSSEYMGRWDGYACSFR